MIMMLLLATVFLCSCSNSEDIYKTVKEHNENSYNSLWDENEELEGLSQKERGHYYAMKVLTPSKTIFFVLGGLSILVGIFLFAIFKKEKMIRRKAVMVFMIGIPVTLFVFFMLILGTAALTE